MFLTPRETHIIQYVRLPPYGAPRSLIGQGYNNLVEPTLKYEWALVEFRHLGAGITTDISDIDIGALLNCH